MPGGTSRAKVEALNLLPRGRSQARASVRVGNTSATLGHNRSAPERGLVLSVAHKVEVSTIYTAPPVPTSGIHQANVSAMVTTSACAGLKDARSGVAV